MTLSGQDGERETGKMAGLRASDRSHLADALLLAALFAPFAPVVAHFYVDIAGLILGCSTEAGQACLRAGIDFNLLHARSLTALHWSARAAASGFLLTYLLLVAGLAQFTTEGFRGRVVRTCAVVMSAAVLPLILGFADAMARGALPVGSDAAARFAFFGNVLGDWLATIAVPLAVLSATLLALTLGYGLLIGKLLAFATRRG
jgi:hypothetical protein